MAATETRVGNGHAVSHNGNGHAPSPASAMATIIPAMSFSWEISNIDNVFSNGAAVARFNDLTKEAMLQAIKEKDLRFLTVRFHFYKLINGWAHKE